MMREARASSGGLSIARLLRGATMLGVLLVACAKPAPLAPLLTLGDLPLSKSAVALEGQDAVLEVSLSELRVSGKPLLALEKGRFLPGDVDDGKVPKLIAELRPHVTGHPLSIAAHIMLSDVTVALLINSLRAAGARSLAFQVRKPESSNEVGFLVLSNFRVSNNGDGGTGRPWADTLDAWDDIYDRCRRITGSSCLPRPAAVALDGELRMELELLPDGARVNLRSVHAEPVNPGTRPMAADARAFLHPEDVEGGSVEKLATEGFFRFSTRSLVLPDPPDDERSGDMFGRLCRFKPCTLHVPLRAFALGRLITALGALFATPSVTATVVLERPLDFSLRESVL
jgi:hypothetical protein